MRWRREAQVDAATHAGYVARRCGTPRWLQECFRELDPCLQRVDHNDIVHGGFEVRVTAALAELFSLSSYSHSDKFIFGRHQDNAGPVGWHTSRVSQDLDTLAH